MSNMKSYKKNVGILEKRTPKRSNRLVQIELDAIARFGGQAKELESALGMLRLGDHLGWKPLLMIHDKKTIRKYEDILDIEIREFFEEEGPSARRSVGYYLATKTKKFWKVIRGEVKVANKGDIAE